MTLDEILKQRFPKEMKEFAKAHWNFKVFAPQSLDDPAQISVVLEIGKKRCTKVRRLVLDLSVLATDQAKVRARYGL